YGACGNSECSTYRFGLPSLRKVEAKRQTFRAHGSSGPECVARTSVSCSAWPKLPQLSLICGSRSEYGRGRTRCRYTTLASLASEPVVSWTSCADAWPFTCLQIDAGHMCVSDSTACT